MAGYHACLQLFYYFEQNKKSNFSSKIVIFYSHKYLQKWISLHCINILKMTYWNSTTKCTKQCMKNKQNLIYIFKKIEIIGVTNIYSFRIAHQICRHFKDLITSTNGTDQDYFYGCRNRGARSAKTNHLLF